MSSQSLHKLLASLFALIQIQIRAFLPTPYCTLHTETHAHHAGAPYLYPLLPTSS